jgi:serine/threonine protein kinase
MNFCTYCSRYHAPSDPSCRKPGALAASPTVVDPTDEGDQKRNLIGTRIGPWVITEFLDEGGMGAVYAATDPISSAEVAVKVLKLDELVTTFPVEERQRKKEGAKQRFLHEAKVASEVGRNQPNIIQILTWGEIDPDRPYFVMEYLYGRSLAKRILDDPPRGTELRRLLEQMCDALQVIHQAGVFHRDLKPGNIWVVEPKSGLSSAKVLDFGLSKVEGNHSLTKSGQIMGSVCYMSPEQAQSLTVDARSDIYSLGAILREMVTGKSLFSESERPIAAILLDVILTPPPPLVPRPGFVVSLELSKLIQSCLDKNPDLRPSNISELKVKLLAALDQCSNCEPTTTTLDQKTPTPPQPIVLSPAVGEVLTNQSSVPSTTAVLRRAISTRSRNLGIFGMGILLIVTIVVGLTWKRSDSNIVNTTAAPKIPPLTMTPDAQSSPLATVPSINSEPDASRRSPLRKHPRTVTIPRPNMPLQEPAPSHTQTAGLEPAPSPATPITPTASQRLPAPPLPAMVQHPRSIPVRVADPQNEPRNSARSMTPAERDLITDKDILFK